MVAGLGGGGWDPRYLGWFREFNAGRFYEAHDVLEDLWLEGGKASDDYRFHKGLIQLAGAFVHLQKGRLGPAVALFRLAEANFGGYPALYHGLDLAGLVGLAGQWRGRVEEGVGNPLGRFVLPTVPMPLGAEIE